MVSESRRWTTSTPNARNGSATATTDARHGRSSSSTHARYGWPSSSAYARDGRTTATTDAWYGWSTTSSDARYGYGSSASANDGWNKATDGKRRSSITIWTETQEKMGSGRTPEALQLESCE